MHLRGVGGLNVARLLHDLHVVSSLDPDVVILEMGTNDLSKHRPEVTGSEIEELVRLFLNSYSIRDIGVREVIPRFRAAFLNAAASSRSFRACSRLRQCS